MSQHEELNRTVRILAEHGQAALSGDLVDDNAVVKLDPEMDQVEQMIDELLSRFPAMLNDLRRRWSETYKQVSEG